MSNTSSISNCAVFHSGSRRFTNVDATYTDSVVTVRNRLNGGELATFNIHDTAKAGEAWDVYEAANPNHVFRLVIQTGCGCSGMRPVQEDAEYLARKSANS
jgi:hypothetical protein